MTLLTSNSRFHVALVIKPYMVRHDVHFDPRDWLLVLVEFGELLNLWRIRSDHLMATHAGLRFRDRGEGCLSDGPVAVLTLHLVFANVYRVAKLDRLLRLIPFGAVGVAEDAVEVEYVEIPRSRLALVVDPSLNPYLVVASTRRSAISLRHRYIGGVIENPHPAEKHGDEQDENALANHGKMYLPKDETRRVK